MSDYDDRGAYTPPSDRLAFDPRTPVRGGGPAPVTLIVSGAVLVGLVGGVFFLYRDGFKHREAPALVGAPVADVRTASASPPADNAAAQASLVVDKNIAPPPAPAFAPPPAAALPTQQAAAQPPPPAAAPAPPIVAAASPPVAARSAAPLVAVRAPDAPPKAAVATPRQIATAPAPHAVAAPAIHQAAAPAAQQRPVVRHPTLTIASLTDDALSHHQRAARTTRDDGASRDDSPPRQIRPTSVRYVDAPPAAPPAHHAAVRAAQHVAAQPARSVAASGASWVQIGAFSSASLADQGWRDIARLEPGAMAGKGKAVQPVDRDDGSTLYRTYVTGFASVSAAQSFCAELKASGKACMVK